MKKIYLVFLLMLSIGLVAGAVFIATWDIPAPTQRVEKVVPNDRFPK